MVTKLPELALKGFETIRVFVALEGKASRAAGREQRIEIREIEFLESAEKPRRQFEEDPHPAA